MIKFLNKQKLALSPNWANFCEIQLKFGFKNLTENSKNMTFNSVDLI